MELIQTPKIVENQGGENKNRKTETINLIFKILFPLLLMTDFTKNGIKTNS